MTEPRLDIAKFAIMRGEEQQAERIYLDVLAEQPDNAQALLDLGAFYIGQGRIHEGVRCNQRVLQLRGWDSAALNNIANSLLSLGRCTDALISFRQMLGTVKKPLAYRVASNYLMALQYDLDWTAESNRAASAELGAQFGTERPWTDCGTPNDRIRIGFVSGDMSAHPVGLLLKPLIAHLDRERFVPYFYAQDVKIDWVSAALQQHGVWQDVTRLGDAELDALIRQDRIDVLIDLAGHTARNRLPVFAGRAAPCQVSWLGYFATTGIPAMDYVIMDHWHALEGAEDQFSEKLVRLPHSRFCFEPLPFAPEVAASPHLEKGYVTFGSFNNTAKYNPQLIDAWASILRRVPGSGLILKYRTFSDKTFCGDLLQDFAERGVDNGRIELREISGHRELLNQYADIDIALDTFPFSGGYTSCDALWMGVPVVTLPSARAVSRQTYCLLANLGKPDWLEALAARDIDAYVGKAVSLAANADMLVRIRSELRQAIQASPLMDYQGFSRDFEDLMRKFVARDACTG